MAIIIRTRTLRPSTRKPASTYKIDTKKVGAIDTLHIEIDHEDNPGELIAIFELSGQAAATKNSIHFDAEKTSSGWVFHWLDSQPKRIK